MSSKSRSASVLPAQTPAPRIKIKRLSALERARALLINPEPSVTEIPLFPQPGIYFIHGRIAETWRSPARDGVCYVGQSANIGYRLHDHVRNWVSFRAFLLCENTEPKERIKRERRFISAAFQMGLTLVNGEIPYLHEDLSLLGYEVSRLQAALKTLRIVVKPVLL